MSSLVETLEITWQVKRVDGRTYVGRREHKGVPYMAIVRERVGHPDVLIGIAAGDEIRDFLCGVADVARRVNGAEKLDEAAADAREFVRGRGR